MRGQGKGLMPMEILNEKRCSTCGEVKSRGEFGVQSTTKRGVSSKCKVCQYAYHLAYKEAHPRNYPPSVDSKKCRRCGIEKPAAEFARDKTRKDGLAYECRTCHRLRMDNNYSSPDSRLVSDRRYKLKKIGVTEEQYTQVLASQDNKCAICGNQETALSYKSTRRRLSADHCHQTGAFRGLLCRNCNIGLGSFNDDPIRLQRAIDYLCRTSSTFAG